MKIACLSLFITIAFTIISSCKKENPPPAAQTCDIKGLYSGTSLTSLGISSNMSYDFRENNLAVGQDGSLDVTFGGYKNDCDSIFISSHYTVNDNYYLLKGKLSNNNNTITGTYLNISTPTDHGTFVMNK